MIDKIRKKLEEKEFQNAELYFSTSAYKSAITTYKNLINDFPATKYREEALFKIVRSNFLLAENSIESKLIERYSATLTAYGEFNVAYPESKYKNKAADIYETSVKRIEKINKNQIQ